MVEPDWFELRTFKSNVYETEDCHWWVGARFGRGYGAFCYKGDTLSAHRTAYELYHGEIPKGMTILHSCHNPLCVNPDHLRLGTQAENMADMTRAGRKKSGGLLPIVLEVLRD